MPRNDKLQNTISDIVFKNLHFCIFSPSCFTLRAVTLMEESMKKLLIGLALGTAVGMAVSEMPQVKELMNKGKKKVKNLSK